MLQYPVDGFSMEAKPSGDRVDRHPGGVQVCYFAIARREILRREITRGSAKIAQKLTHNLIG